MSPGVLHNPSFEGLPRLEGSKTQLLPRWVYPPGQVPAAAAGLVDPPQ
jgi:hypothetical protein